MITPLPVILKGDHKDHPYAGAASGVQYRQEKGQAKGGIPAD
jgi:hypothetical protein